MTGLFGAGYWDSTTPPRSKNGCGGDTVSGDALTAEDNDGRLAIVLSAV